MVAKHQLWDLLNQVDPILTHYILKQSLIISHNVRELSPHIVLGSVILAFFAKFCINLFREESEKISQKMRKLQIFFLAQLCHIFFSHEIQHRTASFRKIHFREKNAKFLGNPCLEGGDFLSSYTA